MKESRFNPTGERKVQQNFIDKPAAEALDHFKVQYKDIQKHYKPGVPLAAVSFEVTNGGHRERVFLWLDCKEEPTRGFWDFDLIRRAKVTKIASEQIDIEKTQLGKPVGEVLDYYKVKLEALEMLQEPPGKLRAVCFKVKKDEYKLRMQLWLGYDFSLFSERSTWDYEAIRKAKVAKITAELVFDNW
jgi:hypothetical protein